MSAILRFDNLSISTLHKSERQRIVSNISFSIEAGQVVGLIGESGSGKTSIGLSALGYFRPGLRALSGKILLEDVDLLTLNPGELRALRGDRVAYVAQSAAAAFNPCITIGEQVVEPLLEHGLADKSQASAKAVKIYRELELPNCEDIGLRFPHQVSGGQLQRLMAAMAIGTGPKLIIFDEPTTALDVTTQVKTLRVFKKLIRDHGTASIYISHDLPVVAQIADYIVVLKDGEIMESGPTAGILSNPSHDYTKRLLRASDPSLPVGTPRSSGTLASTRTAASAETLIRARGLVAGFGKIGPDGGPIVKAVSNVGFDLRRGEVLGVIGESGSGKSTLARVVAGLVPKLSGELTLCGKHLVGSIGGRAREDLRRIQIVFQSADTALNPKHTIGKTLGRVAMQLAGASSAIDARKAARDALELVQLPSSFEHRFPQQLSGGQKQRVNLARALIAKPEIVICDEVTSALDPLIREQIIRLLQDLKRDLGLSMIFISHDISTISALADEIVVMLKGEAVEQGPLSEVLGAPQHTYTKTLINAVPRLQAGWLDNAVSADEIPELR